MPPFWRFYARSFLSAENQVRTKFTYHRLKMFGSVEVGDLNFKSRKAVIREDHRFAFLGTLSNISISTPMK